VTFSLSFHAREEVEMGVAVEVEAGEIRDRRGRAVS
jgi:hypothetical protein